jgi:predicted nucleic acid-binding protein
MRLAERGLFALCEPVLTETLMTTEAEGYARLEKDLAPHSAHQGLSVADLVVAATAIRLKLTVLPEDRDFETVARFVPQLHEQRISAAPAN